MTEQDYTIKEGFKMKQWLKDFSKRFKSWALWLSIASLIVFCVKQFGGIDISETVNEFMNYLLPVLIAFGIVNNPTNSSGI